MTETIKVVNELLVDIYNDILIIEESAFKSGQFDDVSIKEVHTIEAIGLHDVKSMGEVAKILKITVGTLTVAVNNLVKKGYVERYRCENDRRVVKVGLTKKGRLLHRVHKHFHMEMVNNSIKGLEPEEHLVLVKALSRLNKFLKDKYDLMEA
ncbi:MAG: MarR family winged helix-turn-helix transcriptional regulator [Anaerotignaceae bacterium]